MSATVFFSWQVDTPSKEGRNFIERALERAASQIGDDTTVEEAVRELTIDRDTKGVPGSPPIVDTIFRKIDESAVFVPDVTFVGHRADRRPTPNPNVLIEYGWALKSLGHGRIVPVMNTAFGRPTAEAMPFDMRHLRNPILYECPVSAEDNARRNARDALARDLERAIRDVLVSDEFRKGLPKAAEPPPFRAHEPADGRGRFRSNGEPLGISSDHILKRGHAIKLADRPTTWFRVAPAVDPGRTWSVEELRVAATRAGVNILPLSPSSSGYSFMRNHDGFGVYVHMGNNSETTYTAVFAFTTGEVWSVDTYLLDAWNEHGRAIPDVEDPFRASLARHVTFLAALGITPPFRWIAGMENLRGRGILVPVRPGQMRLSNEPRGSCTMDVVEEEGVYKAGDSAANSLKPFFTKLYNSCGLERPEWLDASFSATPP